MNFKNLISSTKLYVILIIIALSLLLFLGASSYKKTVDLKNAADAISHTLEVKKEINELFAYYAEMESDQLKNLLKKDTLIYNIRSEKHLENVKISFQQLRGLISDNPSQLRYLNEVGLLQEKLVNSLRFIPSSEKNTVQVSKKLVSKIDDVAQVMQALDQHKKLMLAEEDTLLKKRQKEYQSQAFLTPLMILFLGVFALFVFVIAFLKINSERKSRASAEDFLNKVLANTENIINFYDPVFDEQNQVKDFKIRYANQRNKIDLGLDPQKMEGQLISDILPFTKLNGEYDQLITAFKEKKEITLNRQIFFENRKIWLESNIRPLSNGLLVVAKNTSFEKESITRLNELNEKLRAQYEALKSTEEFLQNVIKSTNNVVSYFEPIRDATNQIIDFVILYTNEEIKNTTGDTPHKIVNKNISEVYPYLMDNGAFEMFVATVENNVTNSDERSYIFNNKLFWFDTFIIKTGAGICVTSRNITEQKENEQKLITANKQLKIQNTILSDAEHIAKIGSYRWSDQPEESAISDNFCRLIDCHPATFEKTHEAYKQLIHPNDLNAYEQNLAYAKDKNEPFSLHYKIITKAKKVRHFKTWGHFQNNQLIGVVQDVTSIIKTEIKLKDKNQELKRSNAELESFNRVASHDLQEPIRKIQMFISRIGEDTSNQFTEKSLDYFDKVKSSSERMRLLIKYLLSYSRINKAKNDFVQVNLLTILDKVQEDLEDRILESKITIVIANLPVVKAIPFQMEQLFNNLISNAIKYRGLEDPKIVIDCKKLKRSEITEDFIKKSKTYYRISVMDNGIGFAQEHAEKIFELFQRLHQKTEYSGTGIGLAICKKIVQNHHGHILAESELGKGTSFCFYLPA